MLHLYVHADMSTIGSFSVVRCRSIVQSKTPGGKINTTKIWSQHFFQECFQLVYQAFETLADPITRRKYDEVEEDPGEKLPQRAKKKTQRLDFLCAAFLSLGEQKDLSRR